MTLRQLREYILQLPPELDDVPILLQKDSEGNGYTTLGGVDEEIVATKDGYEWNIYSRGYSAENNCMEEDEWEALKADPSKRAIVLFP